MDKNSFDHDDLVQEIVEGRRRLHEMPEDLPAEALEEAARTVAACDLLLVVGSTLQVYPAASLPAVAARNGAKVLVVNLGEIAMEEIADLRIDAPAGAVLPALLERLEP